MKRGLVQLLVCLLALTSAFGQSPLAPARGETLEEFRTRMDAYFAPEAARGAAAEEGSEYSAYRRFLTFWEARIEPDTTFDEVVAREAAYFGRKAPRRRSVRTDGADADDVSALATAGATWRELGPTRKPDTTDVPSFHAGSAGVGPIEFLTFFPGSPSYMLCGSVAGGLFYSTNGGESWSSTGTDTEIGQSGVSTAAFHPSDHRIWFVASAGNSNNNQVEPIGAGGVFRTNDEGKTWTQIVYPHVLGGIGTRIFKLVSHPTDASRIWIATSSGVFETTDGGVKWTALEKLAGKYVYDLELRPGNDPDWMYATVADCPDDCYRWRFMYSSDRGLNWHDVPQTPVVQGESFLTIEVSRAEPENLYCLVVPKGGNNSTLSIYNFKDDVRRIVTSTLRVPHGQGHSFGVDSDNPDQIYVGHRLGGRRYTFIAGQWSSVTFGPSFHDDLEDIVAHPVTRNVVWMAHHGGVARSTDGGATWSDRSTGIAAAQIWSMSGATEPEYVALALYHDGTIISGLTGDWRLATGGDGLLPMIDPVDSNYIWTSAASSQDWWFRSVDRGRNFQFNEPYSPKDWNTAAALNRIDPQIQYRWANDGQNGPSVMRSMQRFNDPGEVVYQPPYPVGKLVTSDANRNHLIAVLDAGNRYRLYRTKLANEVAATVRTSWDELPTPHEWVQDVEVDGVNADVVYTSVRFTKSKVHRADYTNPAAPVFTDLTQNLPDVPISGDSLSAERTNGGLYLVTDGGGCWYSNDATRAAGNGWVRVGGGLPNTRYNGVEINHRSKTIRAASHGRGLWEHDLVATIAGMVFLDGDGDGIRDALEPALEGWTITLTDANGAQVTATTGPSGLYFFSGLAAGTYTVDEIGRSGWIKTSPARTMALTTGEVRTGLDFGNQLAQQTACVQPPPNMVAWWSFNEFAGPDAHDRAGEVNAGTHIGNPLVVPGKVGNALRFNGQSQYVDVSSHAELNVGTGDFSIDAWIRTTSSDIRTFVDKRTPSILGYSLYVVYGRLGFQMADRPGSSSCSSNNSESACTNWSAPEGSINVADGQWHHVAVTVDRDDPRGGVLYVDGTVVFVFDPTIRSLSLDNPAPLLIGYNPDGRTFWNGDVDEVEIFKRALTPLEVHALFKADAFGKCYVPGCGPNGCV